MITPLTAPPCKQILVGQTCQNDNANYIVILYTAQKLCKLQPGSSLQAESPIGLGSLAETYNPTSCEGMETKKCWLGSDGTKLDALYAAINGDNSCR